MKQKFRMKSWYWGNYCVQLESGKWIDNNGKIINFGTYFKPSELEPYIEEEHGWHHSEEYKKECSCGKRKCPGLSVCEDCYNSHIGDCTPDDE